MFAPYPLDTDGEGRRLGQLELLGNLQSSSDHETFAVPFEISHHVGLYGTITSLRYDVRSFKDCLG